VAQQTLASECPKICFMSEHRKQAAFLKGLMMYEDTEENRILTERLTHAEKNEHCLLCACRLVGLIAMLGLAGLGYSSVLLPQFFDSSTHLVVHLCGAVGLGSLLCLVVFLSLWLWYRKAVNRIHDQCRKVITRMLESRFSISPRTFSPVLVQDPDLQCVSGRERQPAPVAGHLSLSQ
jgi:hypothetical protein